SKLADVLNEFAVHLRPHNFFPVLTIDRLNFASDFQCDFCLFCDLNGQMRAFGGSHSAKESQVWLFLGLKSVAGEINSVVNGPDPRQVQFGALKVTNGDEGNFGKVSIEV